MPESACPDSSWPPRSPAPPRRRSSPRFSAGTWPSAAPPSGYRTGCPAPDRPPCRLRRRPGPAPAPPPPGYRRTYREPPQSAGRPPAAKRRLPAPPGSRRTSCGWWAGPGADRRHPCRADRRGSGNNCAPVPGRRHRAEPDASRCPPAGQTPGSAPGGCACRRPECCTAWPPAGGHRACPP